MPVLELSVTPRAAADRVGPYRKGVLAVRTTRPATEGEANRAVLRLVARALGIAPGGLTLVSGERNRRKRLEVDGVSSDELRRRLSGLAAD